MENKQTTKKTPKDKGNDLSDVQKLAAQCWLAEFESQRNLVLNCQRMMHNLIWINISIIGAIWTVYFAYLKDTEDMALFLAIPIVSSLLGIYWCAQGLQITQMGGYIKQKIARELRKLSQDDTVMRWEDYVRKDIKTDFRSYVKLLLHSRAMGGLIFVVSSSIALAITKFILSEETTIPNKWELTTVWFIGLTLTVILILMGFYLLVAWINAGKEQNT